MNDACKLAPWAFKIIRFLPYGFIAFDGPMAAHLWTKKRKQF